MQIYLARNNQQAGPYTLEQLNSMMTSGQVLLTDLAWHEGMENWQQLGMITGGITHYNGKLPPHLITESALHQDSVNNISVTNDASNIVDNLNADNQTTTNQDIVQPSNNKASIPTETNAYATPASFSNADSSKIKVEITEMQLASKGKRLGSTMFDFVLFVACFIPIMRYLKIPKELAENPSLEKQMQLAQEMILSIPPSTIAFTNIAVLSVIIMQIMLLIFRGQTLGKVLTGIRVVDESSLKITSAGTIIFKRFLLVFVVFYFLLILTGPLAFAIYAMFIWFSKNGVLPHDKLAGTIVLEANPYQLRKSTDK